MSDEILLQINQLVLTGSLIIVLLALTMNLVLLLPRHRVTSKAAARMAAKVPATVGAASSDEPDVVDDVVVAGADITQTATDPVDELADLSSEAEAKPAKTKPAQSSVSAAGIATGFTIVAWALLTVYIALRWYVAGHGPFSNMHEYSVAFVWAILLGYLIVYRIYKMRVLSLPVLLVGGGMLAYALSVDAAVEPLVPALQNSLLLTLHVGLAVLSYGAAVVSFGAAVLYLLQPTLRLKTKRDRFDEIGYKAAVVTFPLMTAMILLGSLWAKEAWGRYWGWDPKETAALVTWLLYAAFLHARVARGWRGTKSAWLLIIGFAAVMFAYFGNYFFGGLHSYG